LTSAFIFSRYIKYIIAPTVVVVVVVEVAVVVVEVVDVVVINVVAVDQVVIELGELTPEKSLELGGVDVKLKTSRLELSKSGVDADSATVDGTISPSSGIFVGDVTDISSLRVRPFTLQYGQL
jgi:hypothetical protein